MIWKSTNNPAVRLGRELAIVIIVKITIILLAGFTIFGSRARTHVDSGLMHAKIFDSKISPDTSPSRIQKGVP
ncbi:MAG: hypothetical protein ORN98_03985 [Alphaproteobacteria bacterium]|nr:hypothetical protein [Alphaproteobacteria bacterium]